MDQRPASFQPDPGPRDLPPRAPASHFRRPLALPVIVGLNAIVFLAWLVAIRGSELWSLLAVNLMVSTNRLQHGLWWTLLTAAFSHQELWHFLLNMVVLWSFGSVLERLLGSRLFVLFFLASAIVSSARHCLVSSLLLGDDRIAALGASGAVSAVLIAFSLAFPRNKILLFGIVPIPASVGAALFVAIDLLGPARPDPRSGTPDRPRRPSRRRAVRGRAVGRPAARPPAVGRLPLARGVAVTRRGGGLRLHPRKAQRRGSSGADPEGAGLSAGASRARPGRRPVGDTVPA